MARLKQYLVSVLTLLLAPAVFAEITIGMSAGFNGPLGQDNLAYRYGVQAAFSRINSEGGIKGEELKLEALDDEFSEDLAERNAVRFANRKNVLAMLGGGERSSVSLSRIAEKEDILYLGGISMPPEVLRKAKNVLSVRPNMSVEANYLCARLKLDNIQRISVIYPESSAVFAHVEQACKSKNITLEAVAYSANSLGFAEVLQKSPSLDATNVLLLGDSRTLNVLLMQLGPSFYEGKTIWLTSLVDPKSVRGQLLSINSIKSLSFFGDSISTTPAYQAYTESLADLNPYLTPHLRGFEGYVTALVLAKGLADVVNPFNVQSPSDALKLPLNVMRRFTGWVQEGKNPEQQRQLVIALSVMNSLDVGLDSYPSFDLETRTLDWDFSVIEY